MENNQNRNMLNTPEQAETGEAPEKTGMFSASRKTRSIVMVAVALICAAILATGTLAYFTAEETSYNVITTGTLSMDLVEETTGGQPWPEEGISGVTPGSVVDKVAYVVNDGAVDFYTRIAIEMRVTAADGSELSGRNITLDINKTDWTESDGYYYYNHIVAPGEKTVPLFNTVTFATTLGNEYQNARIEIDVHADAVQSKNNGTSAVTASGWSE